VEIGIGLDARLGLPLADECTLVREAAELGYTSAWTPASAVGRDSFHTCANWWQASAGVVDGGVMTGISVVPAPVWSAVTLADQAATVAQFTNGHLITGIGTGGIYGSEFRHSYGLPAYPAVAGMRDYLVTMRGLLAGETVDHDGPAVKMHGLKLMIRPPRAPVHLAALGPQMLRLAGAAADGASLNWCSAEQVAWSRERIAEGARKAGRDPSDIQVVQYIRICIDDDVKAARHAYAQQVIGYALARPGASKEAGYRGHFGRMGFDTVLTELEGRRDAGASEDELIEAFPDELLLRVGYFGPADGAAAAFHRLAEGLDIAIVRVITARRGMDAVRTIMHACRPELVAK
jgi:alkanesulfonate monooxygenase SsuD/methylene tetrahydromethanopterin reductase-like flavin-dependent oxidoreductase (luciferase family)